MAPDFFIDKMINLQILFPYLQILKKRHFVALTRYNTGVYLFCDPCYTLKGYNGLPELGG